MISGSKPALVVTVIALACAFSAPGSEGVAGRQRGEDPITLAALSVTLVSTHGAGDTFVGTLMAALAAGRPFAECLRSANAAAAAHVSSRAD